MFGIDSGELLIIAVVALVVIGPKDLPRVMRTIGQFVGRARGMASHFRSGVDTMIRESELEDMEKKWKADNERIMREHPRRPARADEANGAEPVPATERPSRAAEAAAAQPPRVRPPPKARPQGAAAAGAARRRSRAGPGRAAGG